MEVINIVWFKKDLRLSDHAPLYYAIKAGLPILLIYCFEPSQTNHPTYGEGHRAFAASSLDDMQQQLNPYGQVLYISNLEFTRVLEVLLSQYKIHSVFTHHEVTMLHTRNRTEAVAQVCANNNITCNQVTSDSILPKSLVEPQNWLQQRNAWINSDSFVISLDKIQKVNLSEEIIQQIFPLNLTERKSKGRKQLKYENIQIIAGETKAQQLLNDFLLNKAKGEYRKNRNIAFNAGIWGSRLSASLAFGNINIRQIYRQLKSLHFNAAAKLDLKAFKAQLLLRDFAKQVFEINPQLEHQNLNYVVNGIRLKWNEEMFDAFTSAKTGFPLIDASVLCLSKTGFISHSLRALLISFVAHHLWLDWRKATPYFAGQMIDFDPGIYFWNTQIIAGCTGLTPLNILNPIKEAGRTDKNGLFIKQWLPRFQLVPGALCGQPQSLKQLEQEMYHLRLGREYPLPIVNINETELFAKQHLEKIYQKPVAIKETAAILESLLPVPAILNNGKLNLSRN